MRTLSKSEDSVELKGCGAVGFGIIGILTVTNDVTLAPWLIVPVTLFAVGAVMIICANIPRYLESLGPTS